MGAPDTYRQDMAAIQMQAEQNRMQHEEAMAWIKRQGEKDRGDQELLQQQLQQSAKNDLIFAQFNAASAPGPGSGQGSQPFWQNNMVAGPDSGQASQPFWLNSMPQTQACRCIHF